MPDEFKVKEIFKYWFGEIKETEAYQKERLGLWFGGKPETDSEIRKIFGKDVELAAQGKLKSWEEQSKSCLALMILLDQFSLNIHRNQAKGFQQVALAVPITLRSIEKGFDQEVHPVQRLFYYLPLQHSENLDHQKQCLSLFQKMMKQYPTGYIHESTVMYLFWAERVYRIIERFGRFPHRNNILGRPHTFEEAAYIAEGGPPF